MVSAMTNYSNWLDMKRQAFLAFANDGRMSVTDLQQIVDIGCADGEFDELEKSVLINVISNLTRADLSNDMWAKVDELIHKFELGDDNEAIIEDLDDQDEL